MSDENPVRIKVSASAKVAGTVFPITSFSVRYELDAIPTAEVGFAVGRDVRSADSTDADLSTILNTEPYVTFVIRAAFTPAGFETGDQVPIFDGLVLGASSSLSKTITNGVAKVGLRAVGKTYPLSALPRTVGSINAAVPGNGVSNANSFFSLGKPTILAAGVLLSGSAIQSKEIWAILQYLTKAAIEENDAGFVKRTTSAEMAQEALDRIKAPEALIMASSEDNHKLVEAQLAQFFMDTWFQSNYEKSGDIFNGGSVWDAWMEILASFSLRYVPTIDSDLILPITLGLSGAPFVAITPDEYFSVDTGGTHETENNFGLIDTVIITDPSMPAAHAFERELFSVFASAASLPNMGTNKERGLPVIRKAPAWLTAKLPVGDITKKALLGVIPDADNPDVQVADVKTLTQIYTSWNALETGRQIAKCYLYDLAFSSRKLFVSGKVRFDIAPGSLVSVEIPGDRFGAGVSGTLYGHVQAVNIVVDGETAYTAFEICNVRMSAEHKIWTVDEHPLFKKRVLGYPLMGA